MAAVVIAEAERPGKIIFIYALIDPITKKRRYVGKTNDIPQRLRAHKSEARYSRSPKSNWIRGLQKQDMQPEIECLETIPPGGDWIEAEVRWIVIGRSEGWGLLNVTDGGDDIPAAAHSPEARSKAIATRKTSKRWLAGMAAGNAKRKGVKLSEEHKAKIAAGNRGKKLSPEHIEKLRISNTGRVASRETLSKMSEARRGLKQSQESSDKKRQAMLPQRETQADRQRSNWADPAYRENNIARRPKSQQTGHRGQSASQLEKCRTDPSINARRLAGIKAAQASVEYKEQAKLRALRLWSDPEFRAKMKAAKAR